MSASPLSQKSQTKLKTFLKEKEKPAKRFKSLVSFIESATKEELKGFFVEKYEQIFAVLLARFADLESSQKKDKKQHIPNVQSVIAVLKQFILLLHPQIKKKWQYANLSRVMDSCLNEYNKHCVRKDGLDLLLTFMEVLGEQMEEQVGKFAAAIIYEPFLRPEEEKSENRLSEKEREREDKRKRADPSFASSPEMACLAPGHQSPTRSDAVELTKYYFEFISRPERMGKFEFWFELWKQSYFSLFFPNISLELGIIERIEEKRFEESCPAEMIAALVEQVAIWTDDSTLNSACRLPVAQHVIIKQAMDVFKNILLSISPVKIKVTDEWRQQYWKKFIDNLSRIFFISSKTLEQFERHAFLIKELLNIYTAFPLELSRFLFSDTWSFLQQTMLDTTHEMLSSTSPFALDSVAPTNNVADIMLQSLFLVWIRSEVTTEAMWQDFNAKLATLVNWKATLTQWEEKVLQLTYILIEHTYPKPVVPEPKKKKGNVAEESEDNKEKEPEATTGGGDDKKRQSDRPMLTSSSSTGISSTTTTIRPRDARLTSMTWNQPKIQTMWDIILHILGNLCDIKDPPNFSTAISCVSQVVDLMCEAEDRLDITAEAPIPLQRIFLPWILEASAVDEKRNRGRITAYSTLCKLFTRKTYKPPHIDLISHFYRAIQLGLSGHSSVVWVVVRNCTQLFSLPLPGLAVLIPDFLREIEKLWRPNQKNATPDDVQSKSLLILLSLLCYPTHFEGLDLPSLPAAELGSLFVAAVNYPSITSANKSLALWGLGVFLYADLLHNPQKERLTEYLKSLAGACCSPQDLVARTALESLSSLIATSDMFERIAAVDTALVSYIIETLSDGIIIAISAVKATHEPLKEKESATALHFYTLLDGLMAIGHSAVLELPANVVHKVFRALEFGLLGDEIQLGNPLAALASHSSSFASPMASAITTKGSTLKRDKGKVNHDRESVQPEAKSVNLDAIFEALKNQPAHGSELVRESAEVFLLTMLNFFANFPTIAGCEQIISRESLEEILGPSSSAVIKKAEQEEEDDGGLYFVYNSLALFSFEEFVDDNERLVRMIVRDCTGKYVWDFDLSYDLFKSKEPILPPVAIVPNLLPATAAEVVVKSDFKRSEDEIPSFGACKGFQVDPLNELLHFLADNEADLVTPSPRNAEASKRFSQRMKFNEPIVPNPEYAADVEAMMVAVAEQREQLEQLLASPPDVSPALPSIPTRPVTATKYHHTRLLLSHMGFLTDENRLKFSFLENNKRMQRSLKELDKVNAREVAKVGLIYVREGQNHQHEILKNEGKSKDYSDFVQSLGWTVDLKTHRGFLGGLDRWAGSTGETSPYWSSAMVEAIFHDITRMPTKEGDPQQVHKKRHVGNDAVHIVWTENKRDYDPKTITSQFNDVHIVIYPMSNGLYRVQVFKKQQDLNFGPLQDGMIVNKAMLAPLARLTAVNANRAVRALKKENKRPFPFRAGLIREMYERYKAERSFDDYFSTFFKIDDNPQSLAAATAKMQATLAEAQAGESAN